MKSQKYSFLFAGIICIILLSGTGAFAQTNVALNKPFAVSSWDTIGLGANGVGLPGWQANDGNPITRWASDWHHDVNKDSGWIYFDLNGQFLINSATIQWEAGSALHYVIQVANFVDPLTQANFDALATDQPWTTVAEVTNGVGGETRTIPFAFATARQVRVRGYSRTTIYGYSIWEFQCFEPAGLTAPAITTQPLAQTKTAGQPVTFTVVATGNPAPTYQWRKNAAAIAGATNANYTIAAVAAADAATYSVVVTNGKGSVTSGNAVLTVNQAVFAPAITTQPLAQTKTAGQPVTFTVVATGNPAPTYQWRKNTVSITGATSASYTISPVAVTDAGTYSVVVSNSQGNVTSGDAVLTVNPAVFAPAITTQPQSRTITAGQPVTFTVVATGNPAPTYQWRKNTVSITGATSASYTISPVAVTDAGTYSVVVSNSQGNVTSGDAVLTVNSVVSAPTITTQPQSRTITAGQPVIFTVVATGNPAPTYQWRKNAVSIAGATSASYTISPVALTDTGTYTVVVSNSQGNVTSGGAVLTVNPAPFAPIITTQPQPQSKSIGQPATFTVVASGNPAPTYQWWKNTVAITQATGASYTIASVAVTDTGTYTVVVTNSQGNVTSNGAAKLTIPPKAGFKASPVTGKIPLSVTFTDSSSGAINKRYWYFGDASAVDSVSLSPVHAYSTEGSFDAKLVVLDGSGRRADSMTATIRTFKDNPVLIGGRFVPPNKVEITFDNYNGLPTGLLPSFADSLALWYKPGSVPLSSTGATRAKIYLVAAIKLQGNGAPVKDTISLPLPLTADNNYGFVTSVHWNDGTWSSFAAGNGCLVLVKDTSTPVNACGISGKYLGSDSVAVVVSNLKAIDALAVDTLGVWFGTAAGDSVPDFANPAATKWLAVKDLAAVIAATGRDSIVIADPQFNSGVVKLVWCAVVLKAGNDKYSPMVKSSYGVGVDRPANPMTSLFAVAQSPSRVLLSWPVVSGVDGIRIVYRATSAVPLNSYFFDTLQYLFASPTVLDTAFLVNGLQPVMHYYFAAQIYKNGLWSVVTQASSADVTTPQPNPTLPANQIKLDSLSFDAATNRINVFWKVSGALAKDSLQAKIVYSTTGYPDSTQAALDQMKPVPVIDGAAVKTLINIANLQFNTKYYVSLWESRVDGAMTPPTDSSKGTVTTPNYSWQSVTYFTKVPGDTAFAFNNSIRIMTDSVADGGAVRAIDKVVFQQPDSGLFSGFIPASIAFKFASPQSTARFYVGLKYNALPAKYQATDLRMYRLQDSVWTAESNVIVDAVSGYVSVKTNNLNTVLMLMLDTMPVTVYERHTDSIVPENTDLYDTFYVSDNAANVTWRFMCAMGGDPFSSGAITNGSLGYTRSGQTIAHIPGQFVTGDNGVRARLVASDGVHTTVHDVSRQVRRLNSDYVRTEPMQWLPLRVTAKLDSAQVRYALRNINDATMPWTYDPTKVRLFKWYPNAQNAASEQKWVEYSDAIADVFNFQCGGLTWIKTRVETELNFGAGITPPVSACYPIPVATKTWTDIALPFKFKVKVGDILDSTLAGTTNADSLMIYSWERDTASGMYRSQALFIAGLAVAGLADRTKFLGCLDLTGYTILNPTIESIVLRVPPIPESMSKYGPALLKKKDQSGWAIKICSGLADGTRFSDVYCGYDPVKSGAMRYFPLSPSFSQTYAGVYDADRKKVCGHALAGVTSNGGWAFRLAFVNESPQVAQQIVYRCETTGAVPGTLHAKVFDEATGHYESAQLPQTISVAAGSTGYRWLFAGSEGYLAKAAVVNFATLRLIGTYPNPFTSSVRIRYSLPPGGANVVKFTICDLRGSVIWQRMVIGNDRQGTFGNDLVWNTRTQNGHMAAAGIYVLRMTAFDAKLRQTGVFERKMTLLP